MKSSLDFKLAASLDLKVLGKPNSVCVPLHDSNDSLDAVH